MMTWSHYLITFSVVLSSCLSIPVTVTSNTPDSLIPTSGYDAIDKHALSAPSETEQSLVSLAAYLTKPARTAQERARAIYRWITHKIYYDNNNLMSGSSSTLNPEMVLQNRQTISEGYARLFQRLGEIAGLEVKIIRGYSKGYSYSVEHPQVLLNHVWNAVNIEGQWHLLDVTWGAGYLDEKKKQFVRQFQTHYFLTPPQQFIYDHFPNEARWQLLPTPLSKTEFEQQVYPRAAFFASGLAIASHPHNLIHADQQAVITLRGENAALHAQLLESHYEVDQSHLVIEQQAGQYEIKVTFPRPGIYILRLFAKRVGDLGGYQWAVDYKIIAKESLPRSEQPVYLEPVFTELGLQIDSHPYQFITASQQLQVTLVAPTHTLMSAILYQDGKRLDKSLTFVQRKADKYEIDAVFPHTGQYTLRLFAKHQSEADYQAALDYTIEVNQAMLGKVGFPKIDAPFKERKGYLYYPKQGYLSAGNKQSFKLTLPTADKAAVVIGEQWSLLHKQGDLFTGEVPIHPGSVMVYAKFPNHKKYVSVLRYQAD